MLNTPIRNNIPRSWDCQKSETFLCHACDTDLTLHVSLHYNMMDGEQPVMVTETTCRVAFIPLCLQKSSLPADPPTPHFPQEWWAEFSIHRATNTSKYFVNVFVPHVSTVSQVLLWVSFLGGLVLLFCGFGVFFKISYCFLKVNSFQLLIPHWLQNYYHLLMTISTATHIISDCCDFKWKISTINSCKCHLLKTEARDKEKDIVTYDTGMSK